MIRENPLKVVITGLGVISSLGFNVNSFWENICNGVSAINTIKSFDTTNYQCKIGAEISNFNPKEYMDHKLIKRIDRYSQFAIAATHQAINDSDINLNLMNKQKIGVIISSGIGGMLTIEQQMENLIKHGPKKISPFTIPSLINNMASGLVSIELGLKGPNFGIVSACASSSHALAIAFEMIKSKKANIMIVGGSEAAITKLSYAGFCNMRAMSTSYNDNPKIASRPFDKKRDGFVMGEGSAILIIESEEHAIKRKTSKIYCELAGYGMSADAYHITSPDPNGSGLIQCLSEAMKSCNLNIKDIEYINAHGTSTRYNDQIETYAINHVFKEHAKELLISSTKSMTGHLLGAAGALESIICAKIIKESIIPPTINYEYPDPNCNLNYIPNKKIHKDIEVALNNNLGFGGQNVSIVFKKYKK